MAAGRGPGPGARHWHDHHHGIMIGIMIMIGGMPLAVRRLISARLSGRLRRLGPAETLKCPTPQHRD